MRMKILLFSGIILIIFLNYNAMGMENMDPNNNNEKDLKKNNDANDPDGKKEISKIEDDEVNNKYEEIISPPKKMKDKKLEYITTQNQHESRYFNVEPEFEMKVGPPAAKKNRCCLDCFEKLYSHHKDATFYPKNTNNEIKVEFLNPDHRIKDKNNQQLPVLPPLSVLFFVFLIMFHKILLSLMHHQLK